MSIRAGRLRHRVVIQRPDGVQDPETGEIVHGWAEVAQVWAAVEPVSGREFVAAAAVQSEVTARITIRARSDIDATMRVVHRGKIYNIAAVLADLDSGLEYQTLPCSEGVNDG